MSFIHVSVTADTTEPDHFEYTRRHWKNDVSSVEIFTHCWIEHSEMNKRNAHPKIIVSRKDKWAPWINSPIKLKPSAVKYQSPDFPWYTARDVIKPWLFLTRRNGRIRNAECREISRQRKFLEITYFLQYSAYWYLCAMRTPHAALYLSFCEMWGEVLPAAATAAAAAAAAAAVVRLLLVKC